MRIALAMFALAACSGGGGSTAPIAARYPGLIGEWVGEFRETQSGSAIPVAIQISEHGDEAQAFWCVVDFSPSAPWPYERDEFGLLTASGREAQFSSHLLRLRLDIDPGGTFLSGDYVFDSAPFKSGTLLVAR